MLEQIRQGVDQLIGEGKDAEAIAYLLEQIQDRSAYRAELILLQSSEATLAREERNQFVSSEEAGRRRARIRDSALKIAGEMTEKDLKSAAAPSAATHDAPLHDYHRYTCNRTLQNNDFQKIRRERADARTHFFYIYGLDRHSHYGLVQRFSYDLEGLLGSYRNPNIQARCKVDRANMIALAYNPDLEAYKTDVLTELFTEFELDPDACEPLLSRKLDYLRRHSPRLQALGSNDRVFLYFVISELDWDREVTPALVRWLIDEFCGQELPAGSPAFFFFFGIEFEKDDSPVKAEVEAAIRSGGRIRILPELQMVAAADLKRWFNTYRLFMRERQRRAELQRRYFGEAEQFYMEDIERELEKLIDELNNLHT